MAETVKVPPSGAMTVRLCGWVVITGALLLAGFTMRVAAVLVALALVPFKVLVTTTE